MQNKTFCSIVTHTIGIKGGAMVSFEKEYRHDQEKQDELDLPLWPKQTLKLEDAQLENLPEDIVGLYGEYKVLTDELQQVITKGQDGECKDFMSTLLSLKEDMNFFGLEKTFHQIINSHQILQVYLNQAEAHKKLDKRTKIKWQEVSQALLVHERGLLQKSQVSLIKAQLRAMGSDDYYHLLKEKTTLEKLKINERLNTENWFMLLLKCLFEPRKYATAYYFNLIFHRNNFRKKIKRCIDGYNQLIEGLLVFNIEKFLFLASSDITSKHKNSLSHIENQSIHSYLSSTQVIELIKKQGKLDIQLSSSLRPMDIYEKLSANDSNMVVASQLSNKSGLKKVEVTLGKAIVRKNSQNNTLVHSIIDLVRSLLFAEEAKKLWSEESGLLPTLIGFMQPKYFVSEKTRLEQLHHYHQLIMNVVSLLKGLLLEGEHTVTLNPQELKEIETVRQSLFVYFHQNQTPLVINSLGLTVIDEMNFILALLSGEKGKLKEKDGPPSLGWTFRYA